MPNFQIHAYDSNIVLYQGSFPSFRHCIEQAVSEKVALDNADLRNTNLRNAHLDDGLFKGARFDGANLDGANLSDCDLRHACFNGATLYNTVFCGSQLTLSRFAFSSFGGTDIAGADIAGCLFSGRSALDLNYIDSANMDDTLFLSLDGKPISMTKPPIVLKGLPWPIALFDENLLLERHVLSLDSEKLFGLPSPQNMDGYSDMLWTSLKPLLAMMMLTRSRGWLLANNSANLSISDIAAGATNR